MINIDQVLAVEYHRNGVSGHGFFVVDFLWTEDGVPLRRVLAGRGL